MVMHTARQPAAFSNRRLRQNAAIVYIPGWLVLIGVLVFYGWPGHVMFKHNRWKAS